MIYDKIINCLRMGDLNELRKYKHDIKLLSSHRDRQNKTLLHHAVYYHLRSVEGKIVDLFNFILYLIRIGYSIDITDRARKKPGNYLLPCKYLIAQGNDKNVKNLDKLVEELHGATFNLEQYPNVIEKIKILHQQGLVN